MPNWCSTTYQIQGNVNEISCLKANLRQATSKSDIENSWGNMWLGNLLTYCGVTEDEIMNGDYSCRGEITDMDITDNDVITIDTDTAWAPMHDAIRMMVERFAPNANVYYTAIEPGCEIYYRNYEDPDEEFIFDVWEHSELPDDLWDIDYTFMSENQLRETLIPIVGDGTTEELIERIEEEYGDYLAIHRFDYEEGW